MAALVTVGGPVDEAGAVDAISVRSSLVVNDIVYDPTRDLLYASVDDTDATYPNQLVTIDPDTRSVVSSASLGTMPAALAVSADGSALFVGIDGRGAVGKFSLPTLAPQWSYVFGSYFGSYLMMAGDIEVMPGTSDTIAVSRRVDGLSPSHAGAVIVDGGVARATATAGHTGSNSIAFGPSGAELYGSDTESSSYVWRHRIDGSGIAVTETSSFGGGTIVHHGAFVYVSSGAIIDVTGSSFALADTLPTGTGVAVDAAANTVYYTVQGYAGTLTTDVVAYDLTTRQRSGQWRVPVHFGFSDRLVALGRGRLVYIDAQHPARQEGNLVFVDVNPPPTPITPPPTPITPPPAPITPPLDLGALGEYTALTPERILDTRSGLGRGGSPARVGAGQTIDVQITGMGGVPATGVDSVVMNVTAVSPTQAGYLTIFPAGLDRPTISSVNFGPLRTVANLVSMPVGVGGRVSIFNPFGDVDVLFDVAGFYATVAGPAGMRFHPLRPARVMDTRIGQGGRTSALGPGQSAFLQVTGSAGLPPCCVRAVALNVTVTESTEPSFLSVFPGDVALPTISNLNYGGGATIANQVIVRLSAHGTFGVYNHAGRAHVVVDVVGYYDNVENGDRGRFISFEPFRAIDTRAESPFDPPGDIWPGYTLFEGTADEESSAYVLNVTVTETRGEGYLTAFPFSPTSTRPPFASTLNYTAGQTVANHAIAMTGPYIGYYNYGGYVHLVVDVFGAFI